MERERTRFAQQFHPGIVRELIAFLAIAFMAAGYEILPCREASARARVDVVKREFAGRQQEPAILAGIAIAHQDVLPRQCARLVRNAAILKQPDNGGNANREPRGVQEVSVDLLGHGDALEYKDDRPAGGADIDRLIGSVEYQDRSMHWVVHTLGRDDFHHRSVRSVTLASG